jgi:UDP-N-acetylmuramyl pentapeptide phosphotransferase/UDP-N-acetylglucosamine-1-phosphate transferase
MMADTHWALVVHFAAATALTSALLYALLRSGLAWRLAVDEPNSRSLHVTATPRCGGWGLLPPVLLECLLLGPTYLPLLASLLLLAAVCWWDDRYLLSARIRLATQCLAALIAIYFSMPVPLAILGLSFFLIVWGANLFNFMDGANGLSGSMILTGFGSYTIAGYGASTPIATFSATLSGAALGFLFFNWGKAKLFLGDIGSVPAGFLMAVIGLYGWQESVWPWWFPFLVFAPFFCDASWTLLRRTLRGERVWQAHRQHFYQRLILSGYTHTQTGTLWLAMMLVSGALALTLRDKTMPVVLIGFAFELVMLLSVAIFIERRWMLYLKSTIQ